MFDYEWDNATMTHWYEFINTQWSLEQLSYTPYCEDDLESYDVD